MSDFGEIPAVDNLRAFLRSFSRNAQEKGDRYFRENRVENLRAGEASAFVGAVQDGALYAITLFHNRSNGLWGGACDCAAGSHCEHLYAAGKALLAEHSVAVVNDLVAGTRSVQPPALPLSELGKRLAEKVKRPLTAQETDYLKAVHRLYERCRAKRSMLHRDLHELGLYLSHDVWRAAELWHEFPDNELQFWLYIARSAKAKDVLIPAFMEPITDLAEIEQFIAAAQRKATIRFWHQQLAGFQAPRPLSAPSAAGETLDFRVVLGTHSAVLEWKRPGHDKFELPKSHALRDLMTLHPTATAQLPVEAEIIWQAFSTRALGYGISAELRYYDYNDKPVLARLLCNPSLASRILGTGGQPLRRVAEPLRWELAEPGDAAQDYRLRLVQADGAPVPELLMKWDGNPAVYVGREAVFTGPPAPSFLAEKLEAQIPGPAIESQAGIGFLSGLGVALPPRLQERIRTLPVQVRIRCRLDRLYPDGPEVCAFQVEAGSEDGAVRMRWTGHGWVGTPSAHGPPQESTDRFITVYDDRVLAEVPLLLEPLSTRSDATRSVPVYMRITRTFPEVFANWLRSMPPHVPVELEGELASLTQEAVSGRVRLEVTETEIDWFDLRVVLDVSDTTLTPDEIKLLLNARGAFVRLKDKGWKRLQFDLTPEDDEHLARLGLTARELSAEPQRLHALQLADQAARRFLPEGQVEQIQRRAAEIQARVTPELPAGILAELRPYQRDGFHFLAYLAENRFSGILADDMGLGKTVQTLTWLAWLRERWRQAETGPVPATLVVCPKSVTDNWQAEAAKFAPGIRVKAWAGQELKTLVHRLDEADVHVLNYAQLRSLGEGLAAVHWLAAVLDEGQYIKNPNSQTAQVARGLRARHRLVLSGTPIENRLLDLWSLMTFAMPGVLSSRTHFARLYDAKDDPFARRRLAARVRPFLLRRTKAQVARDLPDRIEEDLFCEMEGEQRALYRAELKRAQQMLLAIKTQKELAKQQFNFLTSLLRLRQVCCHPRLYKPDAHADGAKLEAVLEQLEPLMAEGYKVLVFSQFVELLELLKPPLAERGWPMFCLTGDTENRGELVARFQEAKGAAVFLISLRAGGFGLNLTAASYVILFDPWWNPAVENQAIDRTHRIGQTNKVIAYRLLIKNSIEEKIRQLQKKKSALMQDVLGEEKFAQNLTIEDLRYLLSDD